ncbi:hypothetical protein E1267_16900 [Nonomuraea longispora]|uniref:Uncharacterized protein n=1 Tax=Nonomuraea longispora TaxID=1848320 RepID=A0A4V2XKF2_9ACTN|nr:hypothetical protein [Nonomuraea longispora]TDC06316.1 hypothetical protein E1267_16900 [Nonomuraea longispora]
MSKTDKTRPWWVRMADAPLTTCVPVHDHRFGPCTLRDEIDVDSTDWKQDGCFWGPPGYHVLVVDAKRSSREWQHFRRVDRRRSRHQARRELRVYHTYRTHLDEN